jgi:hypothetical protein
MAALLSLALSAGAANLTVGGVNRAEFWAFLDTLYTQNYADTLKYATQLDDKFDLNARYGDLRGELGLFMFEPSKPWDDLRKPLRLADYTVAYSPKKLEVLYGKYYQTFGKGLALRSYSDDDFRHYKSLHGLRGTAKLPLRTELVLLQGRLRDIFFQQNTYKVLNRADTTDQVLGADLTTRPLKDIKALRKSRWLRDFGLGGRYVRVNRSADISASAFSELIGADARFGLGPVSLYGEFCRRLGTKPVVGGREKGLGVYVDGGITLGSYSLLAEYVDYDKLAVPRDISPGNLGPYHFNDPPTPIKSGVGIEEKRGSDERGFGLTFTATPVAPLYVEGVYGRLFTHDDTTAGVVEWEGKTRLQAGGAVTLEGKLNHMAQKRIEQHVLERTVNKPALLVNWSLGSHTLAFEGEYGFVSELRDDESRDTLMKYHETVVTLSYGLGAHLLFTVGWQGVDRKLRVRYDDEVSWPLGEVVWNITDRNILRLRVGSERGGYTCSGGVCRFEAPFTGVKMQLVSKF